LTATFNKDILFQPISDFYQNSAFSRISLILPGSAWNQPSDTKIFIGHPFFLVNKFASSIDPAKFLNPHSIMKYLRVPKKAQH